KKLQTSGSGGVSPGRIDKLTAGELRVMRKDISAVAVVQSLITGRFATGAGHDLDHGSPSPLPLSPAGKRGEKSSPLPQRGESGRGDGAARVDTTGVHSPSSAASSRSSGARGSLSETPVTGRLSDTFSLTSSSSAVLPGVGRKAGKKQLTYFQSVAQIG